MTTQRICVILVFMTGLLSGVCPAIAERTAKDRLGRYVILPENPQRVVALAPNITEIVFALGRGERLVGVTRHSDFPAKALALPKVGSYVGPDLEKIVALKPDLCLAIKDGNPKRVIDRLESLHIPVYAVDPRNLNSVMDTISAMGDLLGAQDKADTLVQEMRRRIRRVSTQVESRPQRPSVFFQIGVSPIVSVGTNTFVHELIVRAGGKNLAEGSIPYPRFSWEQLLALSPEVVIITSMAGKAVFEQVKKRWNQFPQIPAVRNRHLYIEDSNLFDRPSPRLVDALEVLVKLIHPELFEDNPK